MSAEEGDHHQLQPHEQQHHDNVEQQQFHEEYEPSYGTTYNGHYDDEQRQHYDPMMIEEEEQGYDPTNPYYSSEEQQQQEQQLSDQPIQQGEQLQQAQQPFDEKSSTSHILQENLYKFSQYDAIMDPKILDALKSYITSGGDPKIVIEKLSSCYKGYAQMSNLILHWMRMIGFDPKELDHMVVNFLKNAIRDSFDSKKADTIFSITNDVPPWLDFMISHGDWRSLIYELSEKFPNSIMLSFAIQRISESGHHNEIASVATASSSFKVFHRVLTDAIENMINISEEDFENSSVLNDFKKVCCHSQYTYTYAQCFLYSLCRNAGNSNNHLFRRLSEELELHLLKEEKSSEALVRKIGFLFAEQDYRQQDIVNDQKRNTMSELSSALLSMLTAHTANPADVTKLHKFYSSPTPPPVQFLQHPDIFQLFINDLFDPSKKIGQPHQSRYIYVLAYAVSKLTPDQDHQKRMEEITRSLQSTILICSNKTSPLNLTKSVATLRRFLTLNVVCLGILHWITVVFADSEHSVSVYSLNNTRVYMALLKEIAYLQPSIRSNVLAVLMKVFEMKNDLDALQAVEIKRVYLEVFVYLLQLGYVMPTMHALNKIVKAQLDLALIRSTVSQLIDMIEEPYSEEFVKVLVDILCTPHAVDALKKASATIRPFVQHVLDHPVHRPHISASNLRTLKEYNNNSNNITSQ